MKSGKIGVVTVAMLLAALWLGLPRAKAAPSSCTGGSDVLGATAPAQTWYFAEGYTGTGFVEYITVLNPGTQPANLALHFQTQEQGEIIKTGLTVNPASRATFFANDLLGGSYQTSLRLEASAPVVAERPMYFNYSGMGRHRWTGGHCVPGATQLAHAYYFAEGCTRDGFEEWLTLQNPGASDISVGAVYQLGPGQGAPVDKSYRVAARSRLTLYVPVEAGAGKDVSVVLTCPEQFLAERPMYFGYTYGGIAWDGGHCVMGATGTSKDWFFAEGATLPGFHEWLCLQNPGGQDATVHVDYLAQGVGALAPRRVVVPAGARITVFVNESAGADLQLSTRLSVTDGSGVIAERPMYFNYGGSWTGGSCALGATAPATSFYFAEGTCRTGFDTYFTLQNPGAVAANAALILLRGDGSGASQSVTVPGDSRITVNARDFIGTGDDAAHDFSALVTSTNGRPIVAERPMYFDYRGIPAAWVVCLDPGHADTPYEIDPETGLNTQDWANVPEVEIVYDIAVRAQALLEQAGVSVVMTKSSAYDPVSLKRRAVIANEAGAALILHIHTDPGIAGPTTFYPGASPYDWKANTDSSRTAYIAPAVQQASQSLAAVFQGAMAASLAGSTGAGDGGLVMEDRGPTGTGNYGPLLSYDVWSMVPTFTLENNQSFADAHRQEVARSIADGVLACLNSL